MCFRIQVILKKSSQIEDFGQGGHRQGWNSGKARLDQTVALAYAHLDLC